MALLVIAAAAGGGSVAVRAGTDVPAIDAPRDLVADARAGKWQLDELTSERLTQRTVTMSVTVPDEAAVLAEVRAIIDGATTDYVFAAAAAATAPDGRIVLDVSFGQSVSAGVAASIAASLSTPRADGRVTAVTGTAVGMAFEFQAQIVAGSPASLPPGGFSEQVNADIATLMPETAEWGAQVGVDRVGLVYRGPVLSTQALRTLREAVAADAGVEVIDVSVLPGG